jgi:hypothetical protein
MINKYDSSEADITQMIQLSNKRLITHNKAAQLIRRTSKYD